MTLAPEPALLESASEDGFDDPVPAILRWAGGKRWLIPTIRDLVSDLEVKTYYEPFLGGASVFLALPFSQDAVLADLNAELIEVYTEIRDNPGAVANAMASYANTESEYYFVRGQIPTDATQRAARFVYLNHTSYNGIYRVNLKGEYNVPYGFRKSINMPDETLLARASSKLRNATLQHGDFGDALEDVTENDLVFLDPPYTVAHNNNGFVKYNQHLFSFADQKRLASAITDIVDRGAKFILTNAAHASIDELFSPLGRKLSVNRRNAIGGKSAARGSAEEYMFTNIGVD